MNHKQPMSGSTHLLANSANVGSKRSKVHAVLSLEAAGGFGLSIIQRPDGPRQSQPLLQTPTTPTDAQIGRQCTAVAPCRSGGEHGACIKHGARGHGDSDCLPGGEALGLSLMRPRILNERAVPGCSSRSENNGQSIVLALATNAPCAAAAQRVWH